MPAARFLPAFHEWLLVTHSDPPSGCSIVLHGAAESPTLATKIAAYLNEYDAEADGNWIAVSTELIAAVAADPSQRALLGAPDGCNKCPPTSRCRLEATLGAIARRGHVVVDAPLAAAATRELKNAFHAGIGRLFGAPKDCHLIVNPELFPPPCIAPVIADVFLEWLACEDRNSLRFDRR